MGIISPTGLRVRQEDSWGSGKFLASRTSHPFHRGTDFICNVGHVVVSPIGGVAIREAKPYSTGHYSGILIANDHLEVKMFYIQLDSDLLNALSSGGETPLQVLLRQGEPIGIAQDISQRLEGITPHVHCEVSQLCLYNDNIVRVRIDPESLL